MTYPAWIKLLPDVPNLRVVKDKQGEYPYWGKTDNPSFASTTASVVADNAKFIRVPFQKYTLWGFADLKARDHLVNILGVRPL